MPSGGPVALVVVVWSGNQVCVNQEDDGTRQRQQLRSALTLRAAHYRTRVAVPAAR